MSGLSVWKLETATIDDIPALLECTSRCAVNDRHTLPKSLALSYGSRAKNVARYRSSCVKGLYDRAFRDPKYDVIVARDEGGSVIGSVVWARTLLDIIPSKHDEVRQTGSKISPGDASKYSSTKTVANLEKTTAAAMKHHIAYLMPAGHACRYVVSINVNPRYQNGGIGTALINWGVIRLIRGGVPCWVSSGHDAIQMFERRGLQEFGRLGLCLDEWAEGIMRPQESTDDVDDAAESRSLEWGLYVWTWQERPSIPRGA